MRLLKRSIKVVLSSVWLFLIELRTVAQMLAGSPRDAQLVVMYYHGVPATRAKDFERQMRRLRRHARLVSLQDVPSLPPGQRAVAITFDDALESVRDVAYPILTKLGLRACVFIPFAWCGRMPGWDMEPGCPDGAERVLSMQELMELDPTVFCLGSHTMTHPRLDECSDKQIEQELTRSRAALNELPNAVPELACPYGSIDDRVIRYARLTGYRRVHSIVPHTHTLNGRDMVCGRVAGDLDDTALETLLKVKGGYEILAILRGLMGHGKNSPPTAG